MQKLPLSKSLSHSYNKLNMLNSRIIYHLFSLERFDSFIEIQLKTQWSLSLNYLSTYGLTELRRGYLMSPVVVVGGTGQLYNTVPKWFITLLLHWHLYVLHLLLLCQQKKQKKYFLQICFFPWLRASSLICLHKWISWGHNVENAKWSNQHSLIIEWYIRCISTFTNKLISFYSG